MPTAARCQGASGDWVARPPCRAPVGCSVLALVRSPARQQGVASAVIAVVSAGQDLGDLGTPPGRARPTVPSAS